MNTAKTRHVSPPSAASASRPITRAHPARAECGGLGELRCGWEYRYG
ncbi:predicted protein [Plenodomus lingam JN3]|uniref:Predicted protein n=1 Tax=Leptosphaeria maculans (strain JN3 / isolate v23.1.3 / race Av1-4-5-6-7-8) TaxID=985895 RepID=E5AE89_LEPMJ|nr:predicted protein [Plenodomus lingam JN3]CBY01528.1 predicted protein [Plenodomus lingam JN3]